MSAPRTRVIPAARFSRVAYLVLLVAVMANCTGLKDDSAHQRPGQQTLSPGRPHNPSSAGSAAYAPTDHASLRRSSQRRDSGSAQASCGSRRDSEAWTCTPGLNRFSPPLGHNGGTSAPARALRQNQRRGGKGGASLQSVIDGTAACFDEALDLRDSSPYSRR